MAKGGLDFGNEASTDNVVALNPIVGLAREDLMGAVAVMLRETAGKPVTAVKHMRAFSEDVVKIVTMKSDLAPDPKDKRFLDKTWQTNPFYKAGMQYYLAVQKGTAAWMKDLKLDELERARANFVVQMLLDSMAPDRKSVV